MSLLRRGPASPATTEAAQQQHEQRKQKAELRAMRLQRTREARNATRKMAGAEPKYGIYVAIFLVAVGIYSFLSTDTIQTSKTVKGKTQLVSSTVVHPAQAMVLLVVALIAAATIYWRQRLITGMAFIVAGFFAMQTPLPKSASDLVYILFLVPAGYAAWMLFIRMNKEQKEWLSKHYPAATTSSGGGGGRNASRRAAGASAPARARRGTSQSVPASRPSPASGRYTPPRPKSRTAQRKA